MSLRRFVFALLAYGSVHAQESSLPGAVLTRGPYLQRAATNQIVIRWRTDVAVAGRVVYGRNFPASEFELSEATQSTEHIIVLTNLLPQTRYYYSIQAERELASGEEFFFETSPVASAPTRIWVIGDSGTQTTNQLAVRDAYYRFTTNRHTDLWLMLGDNAYAVGFDSVYQAAVFNVYPELLRSSVLWPAIGNHELTPTDPSNKDFPFLHIFSLPAAGECGGVASGSSKYYSFDYGNMHFVCLDSESSPRTPPSPMLDWLERDLMANQKLWTIAYWHSPPYSRGGHDSDLNVEQTEMRQNAVAILERRGVDLVLCGHSHSYERSYLMDGNYGPSATYTLAMRLNPGDGATGGSGPYYKPESLGRQGTVYVVAGSSGQLDGGGTLDHPAMYYSARFLGSVVLDVDGGKLNARFLTSTGDVPDHFTIIKGDDAENFRVRAQIANGTATLTWPSLVGHTYTVYFTTDLGAGTWLALSEPTAATTAITTWKGSLPNGASSGFLRVSLQPD
jgi:hypothetical protein